MARKEYEVIKDFDFSPRPGLVLAFKSGEKRNDLTKPVIAKGMALAALKLRTPQKTKE